METTEKFKLWCIVELFGHQKIAGLVTDQTIGSASFIRVDVPTVADVPAYTRFLHANAIYALNPVTEEVARTMAERLKVQPVDVYDMSELLQKAVQKQLATKELPGADLDEDDILMDGYKFDNL